VGASDKVWWGPGNSFIRGREHLGPTPHVRVMELHAAVSILGPRIQLYAWRENI